MSITNINVPYQPILDGQKELNSLPVSHEEPKKELFCRARCCNDSYLLSSKIKRLVWQGVGFLGAGAFISFIGTGMGLAQGVKTGLFVAGKASIFSGFGLAGLTGELTGELIYHSCRKIESASVEIHRRFWGIVGSVFQMIGAVGLAAGGAMLVSNAFTEKDSTDSTTYFLAAEVVSLVTGAIAGIGVAVGMGIEKLRSPT
ncbi:MAG: hypothetical protein WCP39_07025 [Chlamydiota bacterium]